MLQKQYIVFISYLVLVSTQGTYTGLGVLTPVVYSSSCSDFPKLRLLGQFTSKNTGILSTCLFQYLFLYFVMSHIWTSLNYCPFFFFIYWKKVNFPPKAIYAWCLITCNSVVSFLQSLLASLVQKFRGPSQGHRSSYSPVNFWSYNISHLGFYWRIYLESSLLALPWTLNIQLQWFSSPNRFKRVDFFFLDL